jgi:DNA-binding NarL/FixJ family response regulator
VNRKRSVDPPRVFKEQRVVSQFVPQLIYSRDDSAGLQKKTAKSSRILVIEDDFLVASQIKAALDAGGFEVAGTAVNAEEAMQIAMTQRPTLAITDIHLASKRDGIDVAIELFREHGIRCIFATAHYDRLARERAQAANPLGWLQKPYTMPSLLYMVRRAIRDLESD